MAEKKKEKTRKLGDRLEGADIKSEKKVQAGDRLEGANINSEKKRQLDDPLPGDRLEGVNVVEKEKESIWKLLVTIAFSSVILLLLASAFIPSIIPSIIPKSILDVIPVFLLDSILIRFIIVYLLLIIMSIITGNFEGLFIIFRIFSALFEIRSSSEKAKQKITPAISVEEENLRSQTKGGKIVEDWREVLLSSRRRLLNEEERLLARNRANLRIGILSVSSGITLLIIFLLNNEPKDNSNFIDFLTIYWARIGIVITIGVFAGFFLRLYSLTERAIANNKNEITNIELRLTSGLLLHKKTSTKKFDSLADDLAKEERNFVLKKNETSAIADSDKLDIDRAVEIAIKAMKAGL